MPPGAVARRASTTPAIVVLTIALATRSARADSFTLEEGAGSSKPTPTLPAAANEYYRAAISYAPSDTWSTNASLRFQHDFNAPPQSGTTLASSDDWVWSGYLGIDHDLSDHVSLDLTLSATAPYSRSIASVFDFPNVPAPALFDSRSWNGGPSVEFTYDTSDPNSDEPHDVDLDLDASLGYTHYAMTESLIALDTGAAGPVGAATLTQRCAATPTTPRCIAINDATQGGSATVDQLRFGATATLTLRETTDFALDGGYYVYAQSDLAQAGFFTPAGARWGTGVPLLPPLWTLQPEITHSFESVSVRLYYEFTNYAIDSAVGHSVGGRVQLKLGPWRPYVTGSYHGDIEQTSTGLTYSIGFGVTRML
jgi:hypothetical protein